MSGNNADEKDTSADQQTSTKVILLVSDAEDPQHGEVKLLDDPEEAEHMVETLLEAGFEQERIRVFTGTESTIVVTHRPVVTLVGDTTDKGQPEAVGADSGNGHKESERLSDHLPSAADHVA
jgi:hypothetical protein